MVNCRQENKHYSNNQKKGFDGLNMIIEYAVKYMDSNSDPADADCVYIENEKGAERV
jgi:hypothetical protein